MSVQTVFISHMDTAKLNLIVDLYEKDYEWSLSGLLRWLDWIFLGDTSQV